MQKTADTRYPVHELIATRWSPRAFTDRPVEREKLTSLFEAARWAPSCFNEQPWSFIVATKDDAGTFEKLAACLTPGNEKWAPGAPVLALSVAKQHFAHNDKPNRHAWHDVGLAAMSLVVQAEALGLRVHQMAGFDADRARETFQIPPEHEPVAMIAIGYQAASDTLPDGLREREEAPRSRKPFEEFVFSGAWGSAHPAF